MGLRAPEWIVVAYFSYLTGAAAVVPGIGLPRRLRVIGAAIAVLIAVFTVAAIGPPASLWRDSMPILYILIGYWLPALLVNDMNRFLALAPASPEADQAKAVLRAAKR